MKQLVGKVVNLYRNPSRNVLLSSMFTISLMTISVALVVYFVGGTKYPYTHLGYIPIISAAVLFYEKGAVISALLVGLLLGPIMPLDVENNLSQSVSDYTIRIIFYVLIGLFIAKIAKMLRSQLVSVRNNLNEISSVYAKTLKNYAKLVSERDEQTAFHCERVAYNAQMVGNKFGLNSNQIEVLYWSGLLHDVGKIGISEDILLKPGKLTEQEFEEMTEHTTIGYDIVLSLSLDFKRIAEGVRSHHEKWDGTGYPDQLKGREIPLTGRILAVVDVFEALTSERPYKKAWDSDEAIKFLEANKGTMFDPRIVDKFVQLYDDDALWISNKEIELNNHLIPEKFNKEMLNIDKSVKRFVV